MLARFTAPHGVAAALATLLVTACGGGGLPGTDPGPEPEPDQPATLTISPHSGGVGTDVQITASGFPASTRVDIGFGPPGSEYEVLRTAVTDGQGRLNTSASVPSWAESGRDYVFVVADQDNDPRAISSRFTVR